MAENEFQISSSIWNYFKGKIKKIQDLNLSELKSFELSHFLEENGQQRHVDHTLHSEKSSSVNPDDLS